MRTNNRLLDDDEPQFLDEVTRWGGNVAIIALAIAAPLGLLILFGAVVVQWIQAATRLIN